MTIWRPWVFIIAGLLAYPVVFAGWWAARALVRWLRPWGPRR